MAQAWQVPAGGDLWQIVSRKIVQKVDEDSAGGTNESNDFDGSLDTRAKKAVSRSVAMIRGGIEAGGRYPVSLTPGSVPPEAVQYALVIAAYNLCLPVPSLLAVIMGEGGAFSPIGTLYKEAIEWIKKVRDGASFTLPTDPAGQDYATAVSSTNPAVLGIVWGDQDGSDVDHEAGYSTDPTTGAILTLPIDMKL